MGQQITGQAPTPGDSASFLYRDSLPRVVASGTYTLSKPVNTEFVSGTVTHNLGYIPTMLCFTDAGGSAWHQIPFVSVAYNSGADTGKVAASADAYASETILVFSVTTPNLSAGNLNYSLGFTYNFRYYLFADEAP